MLIIKLYRNTLSTKKTIVVAAHATTSTDEFPNPFTGCEAVIDACGAMPKEAENDTRLCQYVFTNTG